MFLYELLKEGALRAVAHRRWRWFSHRRSIGWLIASLKPVLSRYRLPADLQRSCLHLPHRAASEGP
jgi:hypothetical protein